MDDDYLVGGTTSHQLFDIINASDMKSITGGYKNKRRYKPSPINNGQSPVQSASLKQVGSTQTVKSASKNFNSGGTITQVSPRFSA